MRTVLVALVALVLGTVAALAFVEWVTRDGEPAGPANVVDRAPPPQQQAIMPNADGVLATQDPRAPAGPPPPGGVVMPPPKAPPGSWGAVPAVSRLKGLGASAAPVGQGLTALAPALSTCYGDYLAKMDDSNELPTLILSLETKVDEVVVVEAAPMSEGGAPPEFFACAIRLVKGQTFRAPGVKPGQRQRLVHPIRP